jgi:hypothetical protein
MSTTGANPKPDLMFTRHSPWTVESLVGYTRVSNSCQPPPIGLPAGRPRFQAHRTQSQQPAARRAPDPWAVRSRGVPLAEYITPVPSTKPSIDVVLGTELIDPAAVPRYPPTQALALCGGVRQAVHDLCGRGPGRTGSSDVLSRVRTGKHSAGTPSGADPKGHTQGHAASVRYGSRALHTRHHRCDSPPP